MKKINIIYLLPEMKGASGGAKIIYKHSAIINNMNKNISSSVTHLKKKITYKLITSLSKKIKFLVPKYSGWQGKNMKVSKNFSPSNQWMLSKTTFGKSLNFDSNYDFIIIPEIWAHFAQDLSFKKKKINYAIFVQGFFHMQSTDNFIKLKESYKNSKYIISDSKYSINCINQMFPEFKDKILRINFSIDSKKFNITNKKNLITYMPRKLPDHASLLIFYLNNLLPKNWQIKPLVNMSQKKLFKLMEKSKIFLSFSHFEGIGMPPIEAALCGNKVIGYNGGGGAEYWKGKIFKKVESGNIAEFGQKVLKEVNNYNPSWLKKTKIERNNLLNQYSKKKEIKSLNFLVKKIKATMKN